MKSRVVVCLLACFSPAHSVLARPSFKVAWKITGNIGFSGPNEIRDSTTGKTLGIVVCEVGSGVVCFRPDGTRLWEYPISPPVTAYPAVADVDGDGAEDVVACDGQGNIALLGADGKAEWTSRTPGAVRADSCAALADLDGDGAPEILVGDISGHVSCFSSTGRLLWQFRGEGEQMGPVRVADIYDTPGQEIIVTSGDGHIYALTAQGRWLWDIYRRNDLFPNSTPLLADVDGNAIPELYVGGGLHHFYRIGLEKPGVSLEENVYLHVNNAICATDIDGDGKDEVIFGNKGGAARCYGAEGFRWKREFTNGHMSTAPLVVNLDADPDLEVMFISDRVQALDTDGSVLLDVVSPISINSAPLAGDFDSDGLMEVVLAGHGMFGSNALAYLDWDVPYRDDPRARTVYAGSRAHTGRRADAKAYPILKSPIQEKKDSSAAFSPHGDTRLLSGWNTWRFDVSNPDKQRLVLLTDVTHPDGSARRFSNHVLAPIQRVALTFYVGDPGTYHITQQLIDADHGTILSSKETQLLFGGLTDDRRYVADILNQTADIVADWHGSNPSAADHMRQELLSLRGQLAVLKDAGDSSSPELAHSLRESALRLRSLAQAGRALAPSGSFFAWEFCPWAYFDPRETLPSADDRTKRLGATLCVGEYESIALNVTNVSSRALDVRVFATDLEAEAGLPAAQHLEFRRAVTVPTFRRERVADALPLLDQGQLLSIPLNESQQLWITIDAVGVEPGDYLAELHLKSVESDPSGLSIPIHIKVRSIALPRPRPLRLCMWSYIGSEPDDVLNDLVDHGVTVYFGTSPKATCNANAQIVGEPDFTDHDASIRRLSPHGLVMFIGPQGSLRGQRFLSAPWRGAFVAYLRAWVSHLKKMGIGYEDFALYPYDEPSTPYAKTTQNLVEVAKLIRRADPNILIYADPTSGTTMESVRMLTGLIDIWCPSAELLERLGDELIPEAKRVGKEVWFYDAAGRARTLSCLGIYRWRFWYAWNLGFTGVGWWTYVYGDYHWEGPNPTGDFYSTVYRAPGAMVTSKRWEAARDGVEDYELLYLLRDAIRRAREKGIGGSAVTDARTLLNELPVRIEKVLHETGRRLPLTPDSVPAYTRANDELQNVRRRIMDACVRLEKRR